MTSRVIFFICLGVVSALSVESVLGPGVEVSFEEMFYSTRKTINNSKDLENVLGKTCRIMAFQSPIVDLYGVRAYFPNEDLNEVKKLLLGFEKTNGERQVLPPEEEHLSNGYVGSIILWGGSGHFLAELKYYHPNQLVTEDGAIWTSPKYNYLESMLKKMKLVVPPVKGAR